MGRYTDITIYKTFDTKKGNPYYKGVYYPKIKLSQNDIYVITDQGDRYDLLAQQFYKDQSLWWIISIANEKFNQGSLFIPEGTQLRIPVNLQNIISSYQVLNNF